MTSNTLLDNFLTTFNKLNADPKHIQFIEDCYDVLREKYSQEELKGYFRQNFQSGMAQLALQEKYRQETEKVADIGVVFDISTPIGNMLQFADRWDYPHLALTHAIDLERLPSRAFLLTKDLFEKYHKKIGFGATIKITANLEELFSRDDLLELKINKIRKIYAGGKAVMESELIEYLTVFYEKKQLEVIKSANTMQVNKL